MRRRAVIGSCAIEIFDGQPFELEQLYIEAEKAYAKQIRAGNRPMRVQVRVTVSGEVP